MKSKEALGKGLRRWVVKDYAQTDNMPMASKIGSIYGEVHPFEFSPQNYSQLPLAAGSATVDMLGLRVFNNLKSLFECTMDTLSPNRLSGAHIFSPSIR
eukprot:8609925-Ditylum_brightwellii.AAC.1